MASRTQLRLGQITGSFGDVEGGIIDTRPASAAGSLDAIALSSGSMVGVLSEIVSSITRVHGATTFAGNDLSTLKDIDGNTRITYAADGGIIFNQEDGASAALTIGSSTGTDKTVVFADDASLQSDAAVLNFGADDDVNLTHVADTGLLLNGASVFQFRDSAINIGSSADGTLDIEADTQINLGTDSSGVAITIGHTTSEVTVADNLTVTGDLTVNGATTTLDTTNLLVEDRMILLHKNNAVNAGNASGTSAIAFASGSNTSDESTIIGTLGNDIIAVARMDAQNGEATPSFSNLVTFRAKDIEVGSSTDKFEIDSTNLTAIANASFVVNAATDITLDADSGKIKFEDGGTRTGLLEFISSQNTLALSSSAGNDLGLDANTGNVMFAQAGAGGSSPATAAVNVATTNEVKFGHYDAPNTAFNVGFLNLKDNAVSVLSASSGLQIDAGSSAAELRLVTTGSSSEFVSLKAPNNIDGDTNLTFVLPAADGAANQVLQTDGSGNLTFGDASATATTKKQVLVIDSPIAAGTDISIDSGETGVSYIGDTIDDLSQGADQGKVLDVFVNGQLLVSGSNAQRIAGSRDYEISSSTELAFAFDLEAEDLVQIIKRG